MKKKILASNGSGAYVQQNLEVLPDASTGTVGQVATIKPDGTVAFLDPFLKSGGTISGVLTAPGFKLPNAAYPNLYDGTSDNPYLNVRVIQNKSVLFKDGMYIGYDNSNSGVTRVYDGGYLNYLSLHNGTFSTTGLTKFLFGNQADDGTFAQFEGNVKFKQKLIVGDNTVSSTATVYLNNSSVAGGIGVLLTNYTGGVTTNGVFLGFDNSTHGSWKIGGKASSGSFVINNLASDVITFQQNGYVGIGTPTPSQALDVNGNINSSGSICASGTFQLNGQYLAYPAAGSNTLNSRMISNISGEDGIYIGYGNRNNGVNRIFDGGTTNHIGIASSSFSSSGITKWLFGNQADDGTFAQFSGMVKMKSGFTSIGTAAIARNITTTSPNTMGGSVLINTDSLNPSYTSGFGVDGTYASGVSTINLKALGVYSGGGYYGNMAFLTSAGTSLFERIRILGENGNVGIGTTTPAGILDVASTTSPAYPLPRMTTAQVNALAGMAVGAFVFDTTMARPKYYSGTAWVVI